MKKFNRDKALNRLELKRKWKSYSKYIYIGIPCLLCCILGIYFAYSKFSTSKEEDVVQTKVGNFIYGDVVIGAYIDGVYSNTIPNKDDGYIVESVTCDNGAIGNWNSDKWGLLTTNLTKRTKCNVYFKEKPILLTEKVTELSSTDTTNFAKDDAGNNIRYIGSDPNNYVYFNCSDYSNQSDSTCEKWRIIGLFNNVTKSDGTKENLIKIVRDDKIGEYSWDSSASSVNNGNGSNDWTGADLMKLLNSGHDSETVGGSLYWNAKSGTCYNGSSNSTTSCDFTSTGLKNDTTRNAIESVVWNLGGTKEYNNSTTLNFYTAERSTTVHSGHATSWTGKVGLIYPSDYGYATSGTSTTSRNVCLEKELFSWDNSSFSGCRDGNYLYKGFYFWTLTPNSDKSSDVYLVSSSIVDDGYAQYGYGVRPALYLKANLSLSKDSGDGSSSNPYHLNM